MKDKTEGIFSRRKHEQHRAGRGYRAGDFANNFKDFMSGEDKSGFE